MGELAWLVPCPFRTLYEGVQRGDIQSRWQAIETGLT